jgi:hypothetical protein
MATMKKIQLLMLPTNEKAEDCLAVYYNGKMSIAKGLLTKSYLASAGVKTFHLYFLSDEEIEEGDWCIALDTNIVFKAGALDMNGINKFKHIYKKIIATTDSSLTIDSSNWGAIAQVKLPQPSQSFLEVFVTEYNKGNQIKEVLVEYEMSHRTNSDGEKIGFPVHEPLILKVNSKDNTITIKKVKDSWSREELEIKFRKFAEEVDDKYRMHTSSNTLAWELLYGNGESKTSWIEQNI